MSSRTRTLVVTAAVALGAVACTTTPSGSVSLSDAATPVRSLVTCPGGSVSTPEQAAAFYGCESVVGELRVERSELLDLDTFEMLTEVTGALVIADNPRLRSLKGLERLSSVGTLTIARNENLEGLASLESLTSASAVSINGNPALRGLSGLTGVRELERLELRENGLHRTTGLDGLESVGELVIRNNEQLISLAGLSNLTQVRSLELSENPRVCARLGLFPRLVEVRDEMSVTRNFGLSTSDLDSLRVRVRQGRPPEVALNSTTP